MFFNDNDVAHSSAEFRIKMTDDSSKVGTFSIFGRLVLQHYPSTSSRNVKFFTVTVTDPCDDLDSVVIASDLEDQEYTIGDEALEYHIPEFTTDLPPFCEIRYRFEIDNSKGETVINFNNE